MAVSVYALFSLLGMTRRNLRAAGEFSSYPSALKPQCLGGKERGREDRKSQREKANEGEENEKRTK